MQTSQQTGNMPNPETQPGIPPAQAQQGSTVQPAQHAAGAPAPRFRDWAAI